MTINESIKMLNSAHNFRDTQYAKDLDDALALSIEASRAFVILRSRQPLSLQFLLPGETKE